MSIDKRDNRMQLTDLKKNIALDGEQLLKKAIPDSVKLENYSWRSPTKKNVQESEISKKSLINILKKKKIEYEQSFTVHGLTKTLVASKKESFFWFLILSCGVFFACYMIHGRVSKYFKFEIYTEISSKITKVKTFPSISFCEANLLKKSYFAYCGRNIFTEGDEIEPSCFQKHRQYQERHIKSDGYLWSNGLFDFMNCKAWDGMECADRKHLLSERRYNHSCVTWNYKGDFEDTVYGHVNISFHFTNPDYQTSYPIIYAIPHDTGVKEIDLTKRIHLDPRKVNIIKLKKDVITRLPHPFPSNCTSNKNGDIFPGRYSRRGCMESHNFIYMLKVCGDVIDYIWNYLPKEMINEYSAGNTSYSRMKECLRNFCRQEHKTTYDCPFPCEYEYISVFATSYEEESIKKVPNPHTFYVNVQYEHVDTIKRIEEKELYSWYQMVCEIGGFVSVVIGASLISCIEVFVYLVIYLVHMCLKL